MLRSILLDPGAEPHRTFRPQRSRQEPAPDVAYWTLAAYLKHFQVRAVPTGLPPRERARLMSQHGRRLTLLSYRRGQSPRKVVDQRWGTANAYALEVLQEYFRRQ